MGGAAATIVQMDGPSRGAAWGPHGTIVFATGATDTGLQEVPAGGGAVDVLTRPDRERGEADHLHPVWLPDGRGLLFTIRVERGGINDSRVAVLDLKTRTWRTVVEGGYGARYVPSGHLVYAATDAFWAIRFDLAQLKTDGAAVEVLRPAPVGPRGAVAHFDVARDGTLAYPRDARGDADAHTPVWVDRHGRETPIDAPPGNYRHPRLSPDGRRLALTLNDDIVIWEITRPWEARVRSPLSRPRRRNATASSLRTEDGWPTKQKARRVQDSSTSTCARSPTRSAACGRSRRTAASSPRGVPAAASSTTRDQTACSW